jgi:hypothetical protein
MLRTGLISALVLCAAVFATSAGAQEKTQQDAARKVVAKSGVADHEIRLRGHAWFDRNCAAHGTPQVSLDQPPAHGTVCLRVSGIRLTYLHPGAAARCLGQTVTGVRVIYLPRFHYTGTDMVRYTVRFPSGPEKLEVDVTVLPDDQSSPASGDIGAPADATQQQSGPIPLCAALES